MSLIEIDPKLCRRDEICVDVCPARLLVLDDPETTPRVVPGAEEYCIDCGHCVAVCPHGALTQRSMGPLDCGEVKREWRTSPEQVDQLLRSRRSIRVFRPEPLTREEITRLIETARYAPSGHNLQPVEWLVIEDREEVKRLTGLVVDWLRDLWEQQAELAITLHMDRLIEAWDNGVDRVCRDAPHLVVAHAPENSLAAIPASTIALAYLELIAFSKGLGACWAGYFQAAGLNHPPLQKALNLPPGHVSRGAVMLGRPRYRYARIPARKAPLIVFR